MDFGYARTTVRDGKGAKDRVTMLPVNLAARLQRHLAKMRLQYEADLENRFAGVFMPEALGAKVSPRGDGMGMAVGVSVEPRGKAW